VVEAFPRGRRGQNLLAAAGGQQTKGAIPMKALWGILGWVVFIGLAGNFALQHGSWWEFGKFGMPHTLVAADGVHHPNGEEIDPVTLAMARSGVEEEAMLVGLCGVALLMAYVVWLRYQTARLRDRSRNQSYH
jgi:hypothetical protein